MSQFRAPKFGLGKHRIYADLRDAGLLLAREMRGALGLDLEKENAAVLAIPRGGVITGDVIAEQLGIGMDVLVSRKIGAPFNAELAIGAVMHDGGFHPNKEIIEMHEVPKSYIEAQIAVQMKEIERRLLKFRGSSEYDLAGKFVILVDDGIATGATVFAAIKWLMDQHIKKLVVAVPVGPPDTMNQLKEVVDDVVVLQAPAFFTAVGEFYHDFSQVDDDEVVEIMRRHPRPQS